MDDNDDDTDGGNDMDDDNDDANMGHLLPFFGANFNNLREKESFQLHCFTYKLIQRNFQVPKSRLTISALTNPIVFVC